MLVQGSAAPESIRDGFSAAEDGHRWVTVYLPTRGRPALLERAIQSVRQQTWRWTELIVIVDGPCLETERVLARMVDAGWAGKRFRFKVLPDSHGACAARNEALRMASGCFVTGLDDDDYFLPNRIERLLAAFDPERSAFAFSGYLRLRGKSDPDPVVPQWTTLNFKQLLRSNVVGNQVMTTLDRMRAIGGFDETLPAWQDHDCWLRLIERFGPAVGIADLSYVQDLTGAPSRISSDPGRVDEAAQRFIAKYAAFATPAFASFVRMNRTFYGTSVLRWWDPLLILVEDRRWFIPSLRHYLGGQLNFLAAVLRCAGRTSTR